MVSRSNIKQEITKSNTKKKKKKNKEVAGLGKWVKENLGPKGLKYHAYKLPGMANELLRTLPLEIMEKGGQIKKQKKSKKIMSGADFVASLYNKEK
tara:strand:+ start:410 stop:697 length:288 start_codon:yes stop_codon:yes gene_type:complete